VGDNLPISMKAGPASTLKLFYNGAQLGATVPNASSISSNSTVSSSGSQLIVAEATAGGVTVRDTVSFFVASPTPEGPVPAGLRNGINFEPGDTSATLVFFAPGKTDVMVLGDFNDWTESTRYQMTRSSDGRFWLRITGLTPGTEYGYQFLVDGSLRIADYYTEKVLDPWNDPYIGPSRYPGLKAYPTGKATGIVSVLQTAKPRYNWKVQNFNRPDKRNLVIYELHLRDFLAQSGVRRQQQLGLQPELLFRPRQVLRSGERHAPVHRQLPQPRDGRSARHDAEPFLRFFPDGAAVLRPGRREASAHEPLVQP